MDINALPIVGAKSEAKPRFVLQYTLDGEVLCKNVHGAYVPIPLKTVPLVAGFDLPEYATPMSRIHALIEALKAHDPERQVPLPVTDIRRYSICGKRQYRDMVAKGLLKEVLVPIIDTKSGKNLGSRRIFFFTPQGRAFIRKYVEPNYAVTENT
jgi:hypothetical protein